MPTAYRRRILEAENIEPIDCQLECHSCKACDQTVKEGTKYWSSPVMDTMKFCGQRLHQLITCPRLSPMRSKWASKDKKKSRQA